VALERKRPEDKTAIWRPRRSVRLYFDEIDEILAVLGQMHQEVAADTPDFSGPITSSEELKVVGSNRLTDCSLTADEKDRGIGVILSKPVTVRISPSDDLALSGASTRIQAILNKCQLRFGGGYSGRMLAGFLAACISISAISFGLLVSSGQSSTAFNPGSTYLGLLGGVALLIVVRLGVGVFGRNPDPKGTVVLAYRVEAPTWWDKNRTAVGISLGTNVAVAVFFFFLGKAVG
jgi:hypothetical protein